MAQTLDVGIVVAFEGDLDKAQMLEEEMEEAGYVSESAGFGGSIRDIQFTLPDDVTEDDAEKLVREIAARLSLTLDYANVYDEDDEE